MYSMIMMAAFATGADATAPLPAAAVPENLVASCHGCCGYSYSYGCCGYSYGCCGYSSCSGCYGGGWHGGRKWHGHKHGCYSYGCCGFDYGPIYGGGCCGWSYSCSGCGGCYGGCYGSWSTGCGYIAPYGAYNIGGGIIYTAPSAAPAAAPAVAPPVVVPPVAKPKDTTSGAANIQFVLPAGAKLYVDGNLTAGNGEQRLFYTPVLEKGRKFYYDAKAELVINGETIVEEKRVIVKAGDDLSESFPKLIAAASKKADSVASK